MTFGDIIEEGTNRVCSEHPGTEEVEYNLESTIRVQAQATSTFPQIQ